LKVAEIGSGSMPSSSPDAAFKGHNQAFFFTTRPLGRNQQPVLGKQAITLFILN